jgi:hypothetical protein
LGAPVDDALFFHTAWYKETQWIGAMAFKGADYFVKIFKESEECLFETRQNAFVRDHFNGPFVTVPISMTSHIHMLMPLVRRVRPVGPHDHIMEKLILVNDTFLRHNAITKEALDMVPMDMHSIVHGLSYQPVIRAASDFLSGQKKPVSVVPMHGDMTPWNMFVGADEKIILVDYERAGWHVAYYDLFHYTLQPLALRADFTPLAQAFKGQEWFDATALKNHLILYLMDQIYFDLDGALRKRYRHQFTDRLIAHKTRWLHEILAVV